MILVLKISSVVISSTLNSGDENLREELRKWAINYGISRVALTASLLMLQQYHFFLVKSPCTLLGTITKYEIKNIANG